MDRQLKTSGQNSNLAATQSQEHIGQVCTQPMLVLSGFEKGLAVFTVNYSTGEILILRLGLTGLKLNFPMNGSGAPGLGSMSSFVIPPDEPSQSMHRPSPSAEAAAAAAAPAPATGQRPHDNPHSQLPPSYIWGLLFIVLTNIPWRAIPALLPRLPSQPRALRIPFLNCQRQDP